MPALPIRLSAVKTTQQRAANLSSHTHTHTPSSSSLSHKHRLHLEFETAVVGEGVLFRHKRNHNLGGFQTLQCKHAQMPKEKNNNSR